MTKLLLLLPLIFSAPVLAQGFDPSLTKEAYDRLMRHIETGEKYFDAGNREMGCEEYRMAITVLDTDLHLLKKYRPDIDWDGDRKGSKEAIEKLCPR